MGPSGAVLLTAGSEQKHLQTTALSVKYNSDIEMELDPHLLCVPTAGLKFRPDGAVLSSDKENA